MSTDSLQRVDSKTYIGSAVSQPAQKRAVRGKFKISMPCKPIPNLPTSSAEYTPDTEGDKSNSTTDSDWRSFDFGHCVQSKSGNDKIVPLAIIGKQKRTRNLFELVENEKQMTQI
jgi:hypothetical protein